MKLWVPLGLLCPLLGCFAASPNPGIDGSTEGCKGAACGRSTAVGRGEASSGGSASNGSGGGSSTNGMTSSIASAGSSTGGGTTGGTVGSSSAVSSGGSTGGDGTCSNVPLPDGGGCPNGSLVTQIVDFLTCAPLAGATVQALDADGVPTSDSVTTGTDGTFALCAPPGSAFTAAVSFPGYPMGYFPELQAGLENRYSGVPVPSLTDLTAVSAFVPGGLDTTLGTITATIDTNATCPGSGWTFSLNYPDGGAVPDGGYLHAYVDASGLPSGTLTATSTEASAFLYDIDTSVTNYFVVALSNPDAGACGPTSTTAFPTGRLYVAPGAVSVEIVQVPF